MSDEAASTQDDNCVLEFIEIVPRVVKHEPEDPYDEYGLADVSLHL